MELPDDVTDDLIKRLRRVEGQLRGVQSMLADGRECRDVLTQITAATKALEQAGFRLLAAGLSYCLANPEKAAEDGYSLDDVQRMFLKLA
jgi:DNA-binding FrmR family transcriptional regulator